MIHFSTHTAETCCSLFAFKSWSIWNTWNSMSYEEISLEEKGQMFERQLPKILGLGTHILCWRLDQPRLKLTGFGWLGQSHKGLLKQCMHCTNTVMTFIVLVNLKVTKYGDNLRQILNFTLYKNEKEMMWCTYDPSSLVPSRSRLGRFWTLLWAVLPALSRIYCGQTNWMTGRPFSCFNKPLFLS